MPGPPRRTMPLRRRAAGCGRGDAFGEAVLGGFFAVEDGVAVAADGNAGLHLFSAGGTIALAHGNVGPFAFDAERHRGASMQIGNFAEGVAARPERVAFSDQPMIVSVAPLGGGGEFVAGGTSALANENSVVVQILEKILGNFARGNCEWEAAAVSEVDGIAARSDQKQRVGMRGCGRSIRRRAGFRGRGLGARGNVIDAVRPRDVPILVGDGGDGSGGGGVALGFGFDANVAPVAGKGCGMRRGVGECFGGQVEVPFGGRQWRVGI